MSDFPAPDVPGHGGDDDLGVGQPGDERREQRERRRGRVAAGHGDPAGAAQGVAGTGQLGQAVGPGTGVRAAVPAGPGVGIGEAVVRTAVDHEHVVAELRRELGRAAVRQREEDHVVSCQGADGGVREDAVGQWQQVRLVRTQPRARTASGRQGPDLRLGMAEQQPEQLAPRIPARSRHCDPHVEDYARACK